MSIVSSSIVVFLLKIRLKHLQIRCRACRVIKVQFSRQYKFGKNLCGGGSAPHPVRGLPT